MKQSHYRFLNVMLWLIVGIIVYTPFQTFLSDQSWFQMLVGAIALYAFFYIGFGSLFRGWLLLTFFPFSLLILPLFRTNPYRKMTCVSCHRTIQHTEYVYLARPSTSWLNRFSFHDDLFWTYVGTCNHIDCERSQILQMHQVRRHYVWVSNNSIQDWKTKRQWQIYDVEDDMVKQHLVKIGRKTIIP